MRCPAPPVTGVGGLMVSSLSSGLDGAVNSGEGRPLVADVAIDADEKAGILFFHIGFWACLILQRFGYASGTSALYVTLPIFLSAVSWLVFTGRAKFGLTSVMFLLALAGLVALSFVTALIAPDSRVGISFISPIALFLNCALFLIRPTEGFRSEKGLDIFISYVKIICVFGIAQYFLQFVGIRLFSLAENFPFLSPILADQGYNTSAVTDYYSQIGRSNGFFLLEPSIFSQLLVLAVCVEYFLFNRFKNMPLFGIAYLVAGSGTGILCLVVALPIFAFIFYRDSLRLLPFLAMGLVGVLALALLFPEQISYLLGRSAEFGAEGSSGNARYVGQFKSISAVIDEARTILIGFGPGATDRATFVEPGSGGSIQKLIIDYGLVATLVYAAFVISAMWRWDLGIIPILALVIFVLGGNYIFLSPLITLLLMLCVWCGPPPRPEAGADLE